jgi:hypothetical protein
LQKVARVVDQLPGGNLPDEFEDDAHYHCRVLIGMRRLPEEEIRALFSSKKKL